jgi:class 3 adenylate cyclase
VALNDRLTEWMSTLNTQWMTILLLAVTMLLMCQAWPSTEGWVLQQYMQWRPPSKGALKEDTVILSLDEASFSFLKKRFQTPILNDTFYTCLFEDLNDLKIPNVVLDLHPFFLKDSHPKQWETGHIRLSQRVEREELNPSTSLWDDHQGIQQAPPSFEGKPRPQDFLFPLLYSPSFQSTEPKTQVPSLTLSAFLQDQASQEAKGSHTFWTQNKVQHFFDEGQDIQVKSKSSWDSAAPDVTRSRLKTDLYGRVFLRWLAQAKASKSPTQGIPFSTRSVIPLISLYQVRDPALIAKIKGHSVVLTSTTAYGTLLYPSVLSAQHLEADVLATALDNLKQKKTLIPAPQWQGILVASVFFVWAFISRRRKKSKASFLISLLALALYEGMAFLMPFFIHSIFPFVLPLITYVWGFLAAELFRHLQAEKNLRHLELNMSQLVSQSVLTEIKTKKTRLSAEGKRVEITSMFVDIRNFTQLSEHMAAKDITGLLNTWYTDVEQIAHEYRGTVDKFLGDGALVMFGAPLESTHHADMALKAARHLVEASKKRQKQWQEECQIDFSIGVSLNSGFAFVGFVGPKNKLEYTAIGDTVNTAARLQEQTKAFKTFIVFSEQTLRQCQSTPFNSDIVKLAKVEVRGKERPVEIYTFTDMFNEAPTLKNEALPLASAQPVLSTEAKIVETALLKDRASALASTLIEDEVENKLEHNVKHEERLTLRPPLGKAVPNPFQKQVNGLNRSLFSRQIQDSNPSPLEPTED